MKCVNCGNKAKWKSAIYVSPLCSKCARIEVDKLLETGNFNKNETSVKDFYELIEAQEFHNGSTQDSEGNIVRVTKMMAACM